MLLLASITEPLVNLAADVVGDLGLAGVFVPMAFARGCIPIPSTVCRDSLRSVDAAIVAA